MTRTIVAFGLAAALFPTSTSRAPAGFPPSRVSVGPPDQTTVAGVLAAIERQTGIKVEPGAADPKRAVGTGAVKDKPFWTALDDLAAATGTRVVIGSQGRRISLGPPVKVRQPVSTDGPFRFTARAVTARTDLDTGRTTYDLALDVNWEPRFPVFRIDSQPKQTAGADDRGNRLSAPAAAVKSQVSGFAHATSVRLHGLTRTSARIASVAGTFTVTASPKMLSVRFDDLTAPAEVKQEGVTVKLVRFTREEDRWETELDLTYPPGQPAFESFESWASGNTLRLAAPGKGQVFAPDTFDLTESSQRVRATYRFRTGDGKGPTITDPKGWRLVYETPAPLVEFPVRFELTDIPLP